MAFRPTTLERAFELARTGLYAGVPELRKQLKDEGYTMSQVEGPLLTKQLRDLCHAARRANDA